MRAGLAWLLVCGLVVGCTTPNTGLIGPSTASLRSTRDPGVYQGLDTQAVADRSHRVAEAVFESVHPGGSDGGLGTTEWVYVRSVELDYDAVEAGHYSLSPAIRDFFRTCAPDLNSADPADTFRSGRIAGTGRVRLILTRLSWRTEVGPGPNTFSTARVVDARIEVFGATAKLSHPLSIKIKLSVVPGGVFSSGTPVFERDLERLAAVVTADCSNGTLRAPQIPLGGSGWFPRGDVNNIGVEVVER